MENNPRIIRQVKRAHELKNDRCPECGGELDTGFECNDCGFDAVPEIKHMTSNH